MIAWSVQIRFSGSVEGLLSVHSAARSGLLADCWAARDLGPGHLPLQRSGEGGGPEIGAAAREESGVAASARLEVQWQAAEPLSVKDCPASGMNFHV